MATLDNMKVTLGFHILLDVDGFIHVCFLLFTLLAPIVHPSNSTRRAGSHALVLPDFGMILTKAAVNSSDLDNGNRYASLIVLVPLNATWNV